MGEKEDRMKCIGDRLTTLRDIRTRTGVARAIGISPSALAFYERGQRIPPDDVKSKLAAYYGVSVQALFFE